MLKSKTLKKLFRINSILVPVVCVPVSTHIGPCRTGSTGAKRGYVPCMWKVLLFVTEWPIAPVCWRLSRFPGRRTSV